MVPYDGEVEVEDIGEFDFESGLEVVGIGA
ncbi:MAG: hypothetical protein RI897_3882 [Verrucomicrobiota bacterium]